MRLSEMIRSMFPEGLSIQCAGDLDVDITGMKFFSPLEKKLDPHILYISGERTYHLPGGKGPEHISILHYGAYNGEFDWADNLMLAEDKPRNRMVLGEIQKLFFKEQDQILRQIDTLTSALIQNRGIQFFLDCAAKVAGNPLIVLNNNLEENAVAIQPILREWRRQGLSAAEVEAKQNQLLVSLKQVIDQPEDDKRYDQNDRKRFFYDETIGLNFMVQDIRVNDFALASLIAIEHSVNQLEINWHLFDTLTGLIAQELQKTSYFTDNKGDARASFLIDVLNDQHPSRQLIDRKLAALDFSLRDRLYVIVVRFARAQEQNPDMLIFQFQRILTGELYSIYQNQLVILFSRKTGQDLGEYTVQMLTEVANRCHLLVGISREFGDISDLRRYYDQAVRALDYGEIKINKNHKHPLYYFQDYVLMEMLEICRKKENLLDFCSPKLLKLLSYDQKYGTDFMSTLFEFMECSMNVKKTADALFIHKNTLIYRVEKIKSIIDSDLSDSWENFMLYISFRMVMFIELWSPKWKHEAEKEYWEKRK